MSSRLNLYKPVIIVLLCVGLAACVGCWTVRPMLGYVFGALWLAAAVYTLARCVVLRRNNQLFLDQLQKALGSAERQSAANFSLPTVIARGSGEILWNNDAFRNHVFPTGEIFGSSVQTLLPGVDFSARCPEEGVAVTVGARMYTIHYAHTAREDEPLCVIWFVDDHDLKTYTKEYFDSRPSVLTMVIDNYTELFQDAKENERSRLMGEIEHVIETFAEENRGLLKKLEKDRYIAVIEERYIRQIFEGRFAVLDKIRAIETGDRISATMSIGVGYKENDLHEAEKLSRQALDMALGRGGDQAAVRLKDGYEFYGGMSKGVEKSSKVRTRIVANAITEIVAASSNVLVMGHRYADLDCLGAGIGLASAVKQLGKPANVVHDPEKTLAAPLQQMMSEEGYGKLFITPAQARERVDKNTLLIIVDAHVRDMLECPELYDACANVVVVDHHRKMVNHISDAIIFFHEPYASSTCEMVSELVQYIGDGKVRPEPPEAEAMLSGIMLDTKNFTLHTGVRTFEAAAFLRRMGADTVDARKLFSSGMDAYRQKAQLVASAQVHDGCAIAWTDSADQDVRVIGPQAADELLTINGIEASFIIFRTGTGVAISARSLGDVNVQVIMESMGGGGHQMMAATQIDGITVEQCVPLLRQAITKYRSEYCRKQEPKP